MYSKFDNNKLKASTYVTSVINNIMCGAVDLPSLQLQDFVECSSFPFFLFLYDIQG